MMASTSSSLCSARRVAGSRRSCVVVRAQNPLTKLKDALNAPPQQSGLAKKLRSVGDNVISEKKDNTPSTNPLLPALTRDREINTGRLAMIGFASACIGEIVSDGHQGIIGQVSQALNLSPAIIGASFVGIILFNLVGAVSPASDTWSPEVQRDNAKRKDGPPQGNPGTGPKSFFAVTSLGFTKSNELFNGRMSELGFLAALAGEWASGKGALGQIASYTSQVPDDAFYQKCAYVMAGYFAFLLAGATVTGNWGQAQESDKGVY